ncbi:MAG: SEC-C domain-containing protein [Candidatus Eisenbacteria sp.]|nr:SEC-C domain-containing protein [Candidatus Eisenbacteria bacterium]
MSFLKRFFRREGPPADIRRNDPCWCGSGKKYKRCCLESDVKRASSSRAVCGKVG